MLGQTATPLEAVLGSAVPGDRSGLRAHARALAREGVRVTFLRPGGSIPLDLRTTRMRANDIKQDPVNGGKQAWYVGTTNESRLDAYLERAEAEGLDVNVGIAHGSMVRAGDAEYQLVLVDADNAGDVAALVERHFAETGERIAPNVLTPGKKNEETGEWVHRNGGHFYFLVPVGTPLPRRLTEPGDHPGREGWVIETSVGKGVVAPPSTRSTGDYRWTGEPIHLMPAWLLRMLIEKAERDVQTTRPMTETPNADEWEARDENSWSRILAHYGWSDTGRIDQCGCMVFTAPGDHGTPRSATAHEMDCAPPPLQRGGQLHLWTSNVPEQLAARSSWRKLAFVAAMEGVSEGAARRRFGIADEPGWQSDRNELTDAVHAVESAADADLVDVVGDAPTDDAPDDAPDDVIDGTVVSGPVPDGDDPHDLALEELVFGRSRLLNDIRLRARAARTSPWATLGIVLGRVLLAVPPRVQIPPMVGAPASLNLIEGIVSASGGGKGAAMGAATLEMVWGSGARFDAPQPVTPPSLAVGSGEAIASLFAASVIPRDEKGKPCGDRYMEQHTACAHIDWAEVDKICAVKSRQGSTLDAELRQLWSGESLGSVTKTNCIFVNPRVYHSLATISVQPGKAAALFADAYGGLLQRLLFFSADDPHAPDKRPARIADPLRVVLPSQLAELAPQLPRDLRQPADEPFLLPVAPRVEQEIDAARVSALRGRQRDPLDAHLNLNRLKLSALVSILHGNLGIDEDVWEWTAAVVEHSRRLRAVVRGTIKGQTISEANTRGRLRAVEDAAVLAVESERYHKALNAQRAWCLARTDFTWREASRATSAYRLHRLRDLLAELVAEGVLAANGENAWTVTPEPAAATA